MLCEKMESLIDNKLIKQKNVENEEVLYFPAVSKMEYKQLLKIALSEITTSESDREKIQVLINK
jgi:hypothetical protein